MPRDKQEMRVVACVPRVYSVLVRKGADDFEGFVVPSCNKPGAARHDTKGEEVGPRRGPRRDDVTILGSVQMR